MKNIVKGFLTYIAYILLSFFILYYGVLYVQAFVTQEGFFQIFMRILVFVVVLVLPIALGALILDAKEDKKKDFINGILVTAVAFILYIVAAVTTKGNFLGTIPFGAERDGWRFFKFFAMPGQVLAYCVTLSEKYNALYLFLTCCIPTIFFGIGIKARRKYEAKKAWKMTYGKKNKKNPFTKK